MAYQDKLNKVAEEFAMFDDFYSRVRKMERRPQENPVQYQPKIIDSKQAAKRYGGVMEVTGRRPAVQPKQGGVSHEKPSSVPQGGIWTMDYSKRKSRLMAY